MSVKYKLILLNTLNVAENGDDIFGTCVRVRRGSIEHGTAFAFKRFFGPLFDMRTVQCRTNNFSLAAFLWKKELIILL